MKNGKIEEAKVMKKVFCFMIMVSLLVACTEALYEGEFDSGKIQLTATVSQNGEVATKVVVEEIDNLPVVKWKKGDKLGIYGETLSVPSFLTASSLKEGETSKSAKFTGEVLGDRAYFAYYPYAEAKYKDYVPLPDLTNQSLKSDDWEGISNLLAFVGEERAFQSDGQLSFVLKNVSCIMELQIKAQKDKFTLKEVTMGSKNMISTPTINLWKNTIEPYYTSREYVKVAFTDVPEIGTSAYAIVRFVFYPFKTNGDVSLTFVTEEGRSIQVRVEDPPLEFQAGKRYIKKLELGVGEASSVWDGSMEEPTKTDENGYQVIESAAQLAWLSKHHATYKKYILGTDIDLNHLSWKPIGGLLEPFKGVFNGNNKKINNLLLDYDSNYADDNSGLFGSIEDSDIQNVNLESGEMEVVAFFAGGICGSAENSTITNCSNNCNLKASGGNMTLGGICGAALQNTMIRDCRNTGKIDANGTGTGLADGSAIAGGICGVGTVVNSTNSGDVYATAKRDKAQAGGILGSGDAYSCINYGENVQCDGATFRVYDEYLDVFIGGITGSAGRVENCENHARLLTKGANPVAGGIVGKLSGLARNCINNGFVNAILESPSIANISIAGGIVGEAVTATLEGCANRGNVTNVSRLSSTIIYTGGISGNGGQIKYSSNVGSVEFSVKSGMQSCFTGGIIGFGTSSVYDSYSASHTLKTFGADNTGGIAGNSSVSVSYCYWLWESGKYGVEVCSGKDGVGGQSAYWAEEDMKSQALVDKLNSALSSTSEYVWKIASKDENKGFPVVLLRK